MENEVFKNLGEQLILPTIRTGEKLLEFYEKDEELKEILLWLRAYPAINMIENDIIKKRLKKNLKSPLLQIQENCEEAIKKLKDSSVLLCVCGDVNVGKSSFCNLLLGKNMLHVTHVQCTSVPTVTSSSEPSDKGHVYFDPSCNLEYFNFIFSFLSIK